MSDLIVVRDLTKVYRMGDVEVHALRGVSLTIREGEMVAIMGPSGSGKSTLMNIIGCLDQPSSGEYLLDGVNVAELNDNELAAIRNEKIGFVFQQYMLLQRTSALRNVELPMLYGGKGGNRHERARAALAAVGMADRAHHKPNELSGGQQQRVACAAATAHRPPVLLFDEPTANLSAAAVERFAGAVERLRAAGATIVIAEHRLHRLHRVADRVIMLRDGRVDGEWPGAEFAALGDDALRAMGLRGVEPPARAAPAPVAAHGPSVDHGGDAAGRGAGSLGGAGEGLVLRGVRCAFRGRRVLDIAEAYLPAGAITAVTGPNGAGKTTLARVVTGLQRHEGEVLLAGRRLDRARRLRESAIVMQDVQRQLCTDSVAAELRLGAAGDAAARRARELLADLGLESLAARHPLSLSGGQQQRLVVAAARLSGRRVVVFDEPSSGVDHRHLRSVTRVMRDLADSGAVVLLISHDADLLDLAADRELRLRPLAAEPGAPAAHPA